jgi:hypothetical protein
MTRIRALTLAALVAVAAVSEAQAASMWMCAPETPGAAAARLVTNPNTNNAYGLNAAGCALIQQADIGYFSTQGFTAGAGQNSIIFTTGVATGTTNFVIGTLPAKSYIQQIVFSNAAAAAVTGGISIGSTANGAQIVAAQAMGAAAPPATADVAVPQASILLSGVSATGVATSLNMAAVTAWNNANVTVTVIYGAY